ncbi:MAG TPA: cysteine--tRNA ligase [Candidatus Saccharimonadales bacterium]|nr:cysteine--tRNA ligase [Candidatus Saccharimonadales bacterium]
MLLHNTLTKTTYEFEPLEASKVRMYTCGPTVYDHIHIGNLRAYIFADTLRRIIAQAGYDVKQVMNYTDVDDKTIARSQENYPDDDRNVALKKLTKEYEQIFLADMKSIGNDIDVIHFERATENIDEMQKLIRQLHKDGFAYIADDGVYFSIEKYQKSGKKYGQLLKLDAKNTSAARINNDEYDKDYIHDFALWKLQKDNEAAWEFELDGHSLLGRPGWHIECSAMSVKQFGQPFDIHTGGVDNIFPHHENEIAQSTAGKDNPTYAKWFVHNEHLLVDGRKMSKSLNNFFTLEDIQEKGFDPLAFRLMVLQSHYRSQMNFTWEVLESFQTTLKSLQMWADLGFQALESTELSQDYEKALKAFEKAMQGDMQTPEALAQLNGMVNRVGELGIDSKAVKKAVRIVDAYLGLGLAERKDITDEQKKLIHERSQVRQKQDWKQSDELRNKLLAEGIGLNDTPQGQVWYRL